jgi:hypothetical protein
MVIVYILGWIVRVAYGIVPRRLGIKVADGIPREPRLPNSDVKRTVYLAHMRAASFRIPPPPPSLLPAGESLHRAIVVKCQDMLCARIRRETNASCISDVCHYNGMMSSLINYALYILYCFVKKLEANKGPAGKK